jgi:hypothetical protein
VQQSRTINLVICEKTAMSSSTVGHEDDGYTHSKKLLLCRLLQSKTKAL